MSCDDLGMGAFGAAAPSFVPTPPIHDPNQNELIRELRAQTHRMAEQAEQQHRRMAEQLEQRDRRSQQTQVAFTRALEDMAGRFAPRDQVLNPPREPRKVTQDAAIQITEFRGESEESADEWLMLLEEVAVAYEWTADQRRQVAVSKLRGSARDWHILEGIEVNGWPDWSARFLEAFGGELTIDQWVTQVKARERRPDESVRSYCYAKVKICRRCPVHIEEREIVRHLTLGLNNEQAESIILAANPRTVQQFFTKIKEWEAFRRDRGPAIRPTQQIETPLPIPPVAAALAQQPSQTPNPVPLPTPTGWNGTSRTGQFGRPPGHCYRCGRVGHIAAYCPEGATGVQREAAPNGSGNA